MVDLPFGRETERTLSKRSSSFFQERPHLRKASQVGLGVVRLFAVPLHFRTGVVGSQILVQRESLSSAKVGGWCHRKGSSFHKPVPFVKSWVWRKHRDLCLCEFGHYTLPILQAGFEPLRVMAP